MDQFLDLISSEQAQRVWAEYWPWVAAGLVVIAKWIRSRTLHWALWPGATKILGLIIEILDFVHLPKLKPGAHDIAKAQQVASESSNPNKKKRITTEVESALIRQRNTSGGYATPLLSVTLVASLALMFILCSCATWKMEATDAIVTAHKAGIILRQETLPLINRRCTDAVNLCLTEGRGDTCDEYYACEQFRNQFALALSTAQRGLKDLFVLAGRLQAIGEVKR